MVKKLLLFLIVFAALAIKTPVFAGGLFSPEHIRITAATCGEISPNDNYVLLAWDKSPNATSYDIYRRENGKITKELVGQDDTDTKYGAIVRTGINYYFTIVSKAQGADSKASEEFSVNQETVQLMCKTTKQNLPWYKLNVVSPVSGNYKTGDEIKVVWDFSFNQPNQKISYGDLITHVFVYPAKNSNYRFAEVISPTGKEYGNSVVLKISSDIPSGEYRVRVQIYKNLTSVSGESAQPTADSHEVVTVSKVTTTPTMYPSISPGLRITPSITPTERDNEIQNLKQEVNDLRNQIKDTQKKQNDLALQVQDIKKSIQEFFSSIFNKLFSSR